ncbi:MAG: hypothetical protein JNJ71_10965 [Rubrivivax sp.]|nr:hypothetical protein [Rubrivivax sp.]
MTELLDEEWQRQEAAVSRERALLRALRSPPVPDLPRDFAAQVARRVQQRQRPAAPWIEAAALPALAALLLALACVIAWLVQPAAPEGGAPLARWLGTLQPLLGGGASLPLAGPVSDPMNSPLTHASSRPAGDALGALVWLAVALAAGSVLSRRRFHPPKD